MRVMKYLNPNFGNVYNIRYQKNGCRLRMGVTYVLYIYKLPVIRNLHIWLF